MIKVAKFGGSSLADAEQFKKVKNIIENDEKKEFFYERMVVRYPV